MSDYRARLVIEHDDVAEKADKLQAFLENETRHAEVNPHEIDLMRIQLHAMRTYIHILGYRLRNFA